MDERRLAFKVGFLSRLAEVGISPDEFHKSAAAAAAPLLMGILGGGAMNVGKDVAAKVHGITEGLPQLALQGLAAAPIGIGSGLGALEGLTSAPTSTDIELLNKLEMLSLYKKLTEEARSRIAAKLGGKDERRSRSVRW
jgi:hypothetical protein